MSVETIMERLSEGSLRLQSDTLTNQLLTLQQRFLDQADHIQAQKMEQLAQKWSSGEFVLAFCGHFSAGKSTMINTLMGQEILPSSPIPTSANVVKVKSGKQRAVAHIKDQPAIELDSIEDVQEYCKDGEQVETVEIYHPNDFLVNKACLLDTPGIDSTDAAHKIATESAMHLADTVVYMMDYNHVQSEINFQFTKLLKEKGKKLFLVINQIDKHFDEELGFDSFQKSTEEAFKQWGVYADGYFYTSLKYPNHSHNMLEELHDCLYSLFLAKDQVLQESVLQSAGQLIEDHVSAVKVQHEQKRTSWNEMLGKNTAQQIEERYASINKEKEEWEQAPQKLELLLQKELTGLLENANLTPFTTRELAASFLESCQSGFKVGFLFTSKKTEQERELRIEAFREDIEEQVRVHLQGHVRDLFSDFCTKYGLTHHTDLTEQVRSFHVEISNVFLLSLVKKGARVTGEAVLNYCAQLSQEIKAQYRKLALAYADQMIHLLREQSIEQVSQLKNAHTQLVQMKNAIEGLKALDSEELELEEELANILLETASNEPTETQEGPDHPDTLGKKPVRQWKVSEAPTLIKQQKIDSLVFEPGQTSTFPFTQDYKSKLSSAASMLRSAAELIEALKGQAVAAQQMRSRAERLDNQLFTVALFGAFSAGKSSFANALMGDMLLPVSPNPTTATINKIMPPTEEFPHGTVRVKMKSLEQMTKDVLQSLGIFDIYARTLEEATSKIDQIDMEQLLPSAKPHYTFLSAVRKGLSAVQGQFDQEVRVSMDEFKELVAKEEKASFVEWIELYYTCPLTEQGISLVDTPGADSINARHTGVAFDYIKNADAVLFVTYYNHAFSHADQAFLQQLGRVKDTFEMDKMFFLVNAADLASSREELIGVVNHVKDNLLACGIRSPRLYPISSQTALLARMLAAGKLSESGQDIYRQRTGSKELMNPKEAITFSGFEKFEQDFVRFTFEELTEVAIKAAKNEMVRSKLIVHSFLESAQQGEEQRKLKRDAYKADRMKDLQELLSYTQTVESNGIPREAEELVFYVKQRLLFGLNELFALSFNPSIIKDDGRILKKTVADCFSEFMRNVSFTLAQEIRATSLRMERTTNQLAEVVFVQLMDRMKATLDYPYEPRRLAVPSFPEEVRYTKSLAKGIVNTFKSPKHFFEQGGRDTMKESIQQQVMDPVSDFVTECQSIIVDYYEAIFKEIVATIQKDMTGYVEEYYTGILSSLEDHVDISELETAYRGLDNLIEQMNQ